MKVRPFLLFLEFVVLSVVLTWLWLAWAQDAYAVFFEWMAGPLLRLAGVANVAESPAVKRFVNYVPFLVLMVITPRMNLRRRLLGTVIGVALIFLCTWVSWRWSTSPRPGTAPPRTPFRRSRRDPAPRCLERPCES